MIISIRKIGSLIRFITMFAVLTMFFYFVLGWVGDWLTPMDPYREPSGQAVKAFQPESTMDSRYSPAERLRLYYWYGE
ncbi:YqzK family protein [Paenibacillus lautus]|uniref:YqzK family protein n=1 Tax=Paenibacillus lautus TaxID=1401 RepID=UPI002DB65152|nr:YqzK family protein [Paenibacillus lautus]MEC0205787.1 YqzK family protein [Paenibacillus lautus]